jgi:hypothetical protein
LRDKRLIGGKRPSPRASRSVLVTNLGMGLPRADRVHLRDEAIFGVLRLDEAGKDQPIMRELAPLGGVVIVARIIGHPPALGGRVRKFSLLPHPQRTTGERNGSSP